jgi:hypothetical protein
VRLVGPTRPRRQATVGPRAKEGKGWPVGLTWGKGGFRPIGQVEKGESFKFYKSFYKFKLFFIQIPKFKTERLLYTK